MVDFGDVGWFYALIFLLLHSRDEWHCYQGAPHSLDILYMHKLLCEAWWYSFWKMLSYGQNNSSNWPSLTHLKRYSPLLSFLINVVLSQCIWISRKELRGPSWYKGYETVFPSVQEELPSLLVVTSWFKSSCRKNYILPSCESLIFSFANFMSGHWLAISLFNLLQEVSFLWRQVCHEWIKCFPFISNLFLLWNSDHMQIDWNSILLSVFKQLYLFWKAIYKEEGGSGAGSKAEKSQSNFQNLWLNSRFVWGSLFSRNEKANHLFGVNYIYI